MADEINSNQEAKALLERAHKKILPYLLIGAAVCLIIGLVIIVLIANGN